MAPRAAAPSDPGIAVPLPTALPLHDAFFMYAQTWHWQPLANDYSGSYPKEYLHLPKALAGLPDAESCWS